MRACEAVILTAVMVASLALLQAGEALAQAHFCATYNDESPEDCSFTSFAMCQQSVSGVGGSCAPQSEAPAIPPPPLFQGNPFSQRDPYAFAPAPMPPPPGMDQPAPPPPTLLPDAPGR